MTSRKKGFFKYLPESSDPRLVKSSRFLLSHSLMLITLSVSDDLMLCEHEPTKN